MSAETYNIDFLSSKEILKQEIQKHIFLVEKMVQVAEGFNICSKWSAEEAMSFVAQAKTLNKRIEATRKDLTEPARKFVSSINDTAKVFTEKLEMVETIIKRRVDAWKQEQRRIQQQAEDEAKALAVATDSVIMAPVHENVAKIRGEGALSYEKTSWVFSVEDLSMVPREYLRLDEDKIKAMVNAGVRDVPGLKIYQETKTIFRSR